MLYIEIRELLLKVFDFRQVIARDIRIVRVARGKFLVIFLGAMETI